MKTVHLHHHGYMFDCNLTHASHRTLGNPHNHSIGVRFLHLYNASIIAAFRDGSYHLTTASYDEIPFSVSDHELNQHDKISLDHYSRCFDDVI